MPEQYSLYEKYVDAWDKILKIKYSHWDIDDTDFESEYHYKSDYGLWVRSSNTVCCMYAGTIKVKGKCWKDIWKAIDTLCKKKGCDHRFVEDICQEGNHLMIHFGS